MVKQLRYRGKDVFHMGSGRPHNFQAIGSQSTYHLTFMFDIPNPSINFFAVRERQIALLEGEDPRHNEPHITALEMHLNASLPSVLINRLKTNILRLVHKRLEHVTLKHTTNDFDLFPSDPTAKRFYVKYYRSQRNINGFLDEILSVIEQELKEKLYRNFQDDKYLYFGLENVSTPPVAKPGFKTGWTKVRGSSHFITCDEDGQDVYVHETNIVPALFHNTTRVQYDEYMHQSKRQARQLTAFYTPLIAIPLYCTWETSDYWNSHISILNLNDTFTDELGNKVTLASVVNPGNKTDEQIHNNILKREWENIDIVKTKEGPHRNEKNQLLKYDAANDAWTAQPRGNQSFLPFRDIVLSRCRLRCTCAKGFLPYSDDCP